MNNILLPLKTKIYEVSVFFVFLWVATEAWSEHDVMSRWIRTFHVRDARKRQQAAIYEERGLKTA